jgi:hypothetical protein
LADYSYLERQRAQLGTPLEDLAREARVPYTRMWHLLKGAFTPDELRRLEHVLGVGPRERVT